MRVCIGRVEDICGRLRDAALNTDRIILLFSNPADALRAVKAGLDCREINIGGMHYVPGKRKLMDALAVDDEDLAALKELAARGIKVNVQTVPTQRPVPLEKVFTTCRV